MFTQRAIGLLIPIFILLCANLALAGFAGSVTISIKIPEVLKLEIDETPLDFDLGHPKPGETYPPLNFPAYYTPANDNGYPIRVFCNFDRIWTLSVGVNSDLVSRDSILPTDRLEWTVSQDWHDMSLTPSPMFSGGRGTAWQEWRVYYRLRIEGDEKGINDVYRTTVVYTFAAS